MYQVTTKDDDDNVLQRLVEMLSAFFTEGIPVKEDLSYSLTNDFLRNMQDVLYTKQLVVFSRWEIFFDNYCEIMLYSTETYLRYVFYACLQNNQVSLKIFEGFLGAFALIIRSSIETRYRTSIDFCKFIPDVFMVFYENVLKEPFYRRQGFRQFVKYINNPKYLNSKCIVRNISDSYDPNASVSEISKDLLHKVSRMISEDADISKNLNFWGVESDDLSLKLAKKVLTIAKIVLLPYPIDDDLSLSHLYPQETAQIGKKQTFLEAIEKVVDSGFSSERCPSSDSDSETKDGAQQMADKKQKKENIETIGNNHSRSKSKSQSHIQMHVDGFLDLPTLLPSDNKLKVNLINAIQEKITPFDTRIILEASKDVGVSELIFKSGPTLSSDFKINDDTVTQMADKERFDNIIEAVIRHNRSKSSCHGKSKGRIETEADRNREHLKSTINSLIQVLDEYDKE